MKKKLPTIEDYIKAQEAIQQFEADNYGYQLTPSKEKIAIKLQEKYEYILHRLNDDDLFELNIDPEMISRV